MCLEWLQKCSTMFLDIVATEECWRQITGPGPFMNLTKNQRAVHESGVKNCSRSWIFFSKRYADCVFFDHGDRFWHRLSSTTCSWIFFSKRWLCFCNHGDRFWHRLSSTSFWGIHSYHWDNHTWKIDSDACICMDYVFPRRINRTQ